MGAYKNYLQDIYGEDWTQRLEDIALKREQRKCQK